jgi:hypothetical protein
MNNFMKKQDKKYHIGIDPGTNTGIALFDPWKFEFITIRTIKIHQAMEMLLTYDPKEIFVRVEDARLRKWFGKSSGREKLQGAGSIKRDCSIWEDFLKDFGCEFEMTHPANSMTKLSENTFKSITGCNLRTSGHGRDAAMLVYQQQKQK